jgi:hypothetical protein
MAKRNIKSTIRNEVLKHADYLEEHSSRQAHHDSSRVFSTRGDMLHRVLKANCDATPLLNDLIVSQ